MTFQSTPQSRDRRRQAYTILGVDPNLVAAAPRISHLIAKVTGGRTAVLEALRASDLPEARHFISKYDNLLLPSFVRRTLPIEAFAVAANLSPTRLWGVIAEVIRLQKAQLGAIRAAERHEAIVDVSSTVALTPEGVEDRMAHLKHMGFTPSPKGSTINILATANASSLAASKADAAALPSPEDTITRIIKERQRLSAAAPQPALPPAAATDVVPAFMPRVAREPVTVDAEYSDSDSDSDDE